MIDYRTPAPEQIEEAQAETLAEAERIVAEVVAVPAEARTAENTLGRLEDLDDLLGQAGGRYGFMAQVAVEKLVRDAADRLRAALDTYAIALGFREDLHAAVIAFAESAAAAALSGERRRLLERTLRDYRRNGFDLPQEQRARVQELKARLVEIGIAFRRNVTEYDAAILVSRHELAGLPESYVAGLKTVEAAGETRYRVSLDYPEFFPFLDNAESEERRRELMIVSYRKGGAANVALLEEALVVRAEIARLLGYPSWAAYALEVRMARTPETVADFLGNLHARVEPKRVRDMEALAEAKRAHTGRPEAVVELWDWRFYHNRLLKTRYAVDELEVAQYFPLEAVLDGMFEVYQTLFGVRFERVEPAHAWHPDVALFRIVDAGDGGGGYRGHSPHLPSAGSALRGVRAERGGAPQTSDESEGGPRRPSDDVGEPDGFPNSNEIAHFYLDLHPRAGKYGHAAAFTLRSGRRLPDGSYQRPVSAMVANFTKPSASRPSLLRHSEVETLFHEFGHILHQALTRTECLRFSGTRTERDFVEAPSQMLEHWVWQPEVLARFSRHIETGEPLPESLLAAMTAARRLDSGVFTARQLYFATLDLVYHGGQAPRIISEVDTPVGPEGWRDTTDIARALHQITGFSMPEGTHWQSGFGHLFGYDAGYYGYLWSEVFADDMFTRFAAGGPLNAALGLEYRRTILERGGAEDGADLVRAFLGREPTSDAFLKKLGV